MNSVIERLRRTTDTIVGADDLRERLASGRQLRIKYGVDCTAPDLHLGHAVNLWMMRQLQDLGHRVVFLLGDLTTRVGDPTGRSETRPVLTPEQIDANAASFLEQVSLVLRTDPDVFEVRRNSEWYDAMSIAELLGLFGQVTQAQLMSRDMFRERVAAGREIGVHELVYPVLQAYDSFAMRSDLTIVGSDQLFNEQLGRVFQQRLGSPPQVVLTTTITPGIDGRAKQSKSLNNYIGLTDSPRDKFGKLMSIPDELVEAYARVYTELPLRPSPPWPPPVVAARPATPSSGWPPRSSPATTVPAWRKPNSTASATPSPITANRRTFQPSRTRPSGPRSSTCSKRPARPRATPTSAGSSARAP